MQTLKRRPAGETAVSVIVPAFNEEGAVRAQVQAVGRVLDAHGIVYEVLVVDDGSDDRTSEEALGGGARVIRHIENRGYGASIKTGMVAAQYETIVIIDADGTYPAESIPDLLAELETADMAVGARVGSDVHIPWARRPAKRFLGWLASRVAGRRIPDLNSGLRAFRRDCVKQYFAVLSNRFSFTTTVTLALLADDYRVAYRPINYLRRIGSSKIRPRNFVDFTILVLRMAMLFQPLRIFVPLGFCCGLMGMMKAAFDLIALFYRVPSPGTSLLFQRTVSTSTVLLLLVGLQLVLIGMLADAVLRRISQHGRALVPSRGFVARSPDSGPHFHERDMVATSGS